MNPEDTSAADTHADPSEAESGAAEPWWEGYPHTTERAVPATESTAGVDVTFVDVHALDRQGDPPSVFLQEYYPPEDDVDGPDTIMLTGPSDVLELATTLLGLLSNEFDAAPLPNDELDDEIWSRAIGREEGDRDD